MPFPKTRDVRLVQATWPCATKKFGSIAMVFYSG